MTRGKRLACSLFGLAVACGGDSVSPTDKRWVGAWVAISVAGQSLPATITIGGYQERVVSRTLTISSGDWATWKDSTEQLKPFPANGSQGGIMQWHESDASTLHVERRNPCLCSDGTFFARDFHLRADGALEGSPATSDEGVTVFRRQ